MAAPPARVMVDTPAGKKSVAATSSAAKSAAPAQKTYNYHKPAEEPFRAPPAQKTYNYHKPAATPSAAPNRAEAYRLATKAEAERPVLKAPKITYETTGQALSRLRGAADNYAQQNLERDKPSADYVDMPWSEYLPKVARGVLPSALEMGIDAGEMADKAVKDPIGTGKAVLGGLGALAMGLGSKFDDTVRSAVGLEVNPFESGRKQQALDDLIFNAKRRYGLGEPGAFWKNLADDPASYIADAAGVLTGGASVANKIDDLQRAQYLRFMDDITPETDVSNMAGFQYYRPSAFESYSMGTNPTKAQQLYMDSRNEANRLRSRGVSEKDIQDQTGILTIPVKDPTGFNFGDLDVAAVTPQQMIDLRPSRATNYGAYIFDDPSLMKKWYDPRTWGNNTTGYHEMDPVTGQHRIGLNPSASAIERQRTVDHEMNHADMQESGLSHNIIGGSVEDMRKSKKWYLKELSAAAKAAASKDEKAALLALRKKLSGMTAPELYHRIPGEMTARLAEGHPEMAKRLTTLQNLNPYIVNRNAVTRGIRALKTALLTETRPSLSSLLPSLTKPYDVHAGIPMDLSEALVTGQGWTHLPK